RRVAVPVTLRLAGSTSSSSARCWISTTRSGAQRARVPGKANSRVMSGDDTGSACGGLVMPEDIAARSRPQVFPSQAKQHVKRGAYAVIRSRGEVLRDRLRVDLLGRRARWGG